MTITLVREGKTQSWQKVNQYHMVFRPKDDVTLGGRVIHTCSGKGRLMAQSSARCFEVLGRAGVPHHFIRHEAYEGAFVARRLRMIPLEVVIRRVPTGSFRQRHPHCRVRSFEIPLVEFFRKVEVGPAGPDPYLVPDFQRRRFGVYPARERFVEEQPIARLYFREVFSGLGNAPQLMSEMTELARKTFLALEDAWGRVDDCRLLDLKIEFGIDAHGTLMVADELTPDNWRLVDRHGKNLSKDVAREGGSRYELMSALRRAVALTRRRAFLGI